MGSGLVCGRRLTGGKGRGMPCMELRLGLHHTHGLS